jgi:hypothetical protein
LRQVFSETSSCINHHPSASIEKIKTTEVFSWHGDLVPNHSRACKPGGPARLLERESREIHRLHRSGWRKNAPSCAGLKFRPERADHDRHERIRSQDSSAPPAPRGRAGRAHREHAAASRSPSRGRTGRRSSIDRAPNSETVVELAREHARGCRRSRPTRILDKTLAVLVEEIRAKGGDAIVQTANVTGDRNVTTQIAGAGNFVRR